MARERWIWRNGEMIQVGGDFAPRTRGKGRGLQIVKDIEPYQSPVDNAYVGSRRARRDDLKRHNCREYEPSEKKYIEQARQDADRRLVDRMGETMHRFYRE